MNQTLATANRNQIRNVNPKLFAESGKPKWRWPLGMKAILLKGNFKNA